MDAVPSFSSFVDSLSGRTGALIRQCLADLITIRDGSALNLAEMVGIDRSITRIETIQIEARRQRRYYHSHGPFARTSRLANRIHPGVT